MRKLGFTLAEVLITLGIIGVVAALTTPVLVQKTDSAKVGPKLQKARATFEVAAEMALADNSTSMLSNIINSNKTDSISYSRALGNELEKYMKITYNPTRYDVSSYTGGTFSLGTFDRYDSDDGITYWISTDGSVELVASDYANIPNNQLIGQIYVDINGPEPPNKVAKDLFSFLMYNDGTLRPLGGLRADRSKDVADTATWRDGNCDENGVETPNTCAGSIFENGMKIIYQ